MQGKSVTRIAGWDTHGLPVEIEVEKELEAQRQEGDRGVRRARSSTPAPAQSVFKYQAEWEALSDRIAYWLDYEHPYVTCTNDYIESVWWLLARLHERDLLYRGHRVLPYCPRCGTVLSSHELAQGYEDVTTNSVYVTFPLDDGSGRELLVWTTTPWTLLSNVAVAVHPDLEYGEYAGRRTARLILATARAGLPSGPGQGRARASRSSARGARSRAASWSGSRYRAAARGGAAAGRPGLARRRSPGDFVTAEDGTGMVHMAPAFGADDYQAGSEHGLALVRPVGADGTFTGTSWPEIEGRLVTDEETNDLIIQRLKRDGRWHLTEPYSHSYPHCWRCAQPADLLRARLLVRAHVGGQGADAGAQPRGRTGIRPRSAPAASASGWRTTWTGRSRATATGARRCRSGCATAIRRHVEVIGSYAELAERSGQAAAGRTSIRTSRSSTSTPGPAPCGGTMRRTPEVIDAWFDSGAMPYAQWHYPFEHEAEFASAVPGRLHLRGAGPDARLVLLAARDRERACSTARRTAT